MADVFRYPLNEMIAGTLYRVDRFIGAGGMATVYQVTDMSCGRRYAFKHLSSELRGRKDLRRLFVEEGKLLGSLHGNPNTVEVITQGITADDLDVPFIVLELLNGPNGRTVLVKQGKQPASVVIDIMLGVLGALDHAHGRGVVHRDVKPENIVFHRDPDGQPRAKLIDFGIHKARNERSSRLVGTPLYMAPELLDDRPVEPQLEHLVDVYSAGITTYEFIVGRAPFDGEPNEEALLRAHRSKAPPPPSNFVGGLPVQLEDAIMRALEKDPRKRWPDAFAFANALKQCAVGGGQGRASVDLDAHTRVTAKQIPTQVGTPVEEQSADRTEPGPPPEEGTDPSQGTQIPATEPGVPQDVLNMMIARATAGENRTNPGTPDARKAAQHTTDEIPRRDQITHEGAASAKEAVERPRLSQVATRSRPGLVQPASRRAPGDTPAIDLPIHEDPNAPESWRRPQSIDAQGEHTAKSPEGPDRVWIDEDSLAKQAALLRPSETDPTSTRSARIVVPESATSKKPFKIDRLMVVVFALTTLVGSIAVVILQRRSTLDAGPRLAQPATLATTVTIPMPSSSHEFSPAFVLTAEPSPAAPLVTGATSVTRPPAPDTSEESRLQPPRKTTRTTRSSDSVPDPFLDPPPAHSAKRP